MAARQVNYYDYDGSRTLTCPDCGWSGKAGKGNREDYRELYDVSCPTCDRMLLIVPYPTHEETRVAAAADHSEAELNLVMVEQREAFFARAEEHKLTETGELPDLDGDELVIDWDFEEPAEGEGPGDKWTVLRYGDQVIWREFAFYEGYERFGEVLEILRTRYGERLADLRPTEDSYNYLLGDVLRAGGIVRSLRKSLRPEGRNAEKG
jgi:hypothetical protein